MSHSILTTSLFVQGKPAASPSLGLKRRKTNDLADRCPELQSHYNYPTIDSELALKKGCTDYNFLNDDICSLPTHQQTLCGGRDDLHYSQAWYVHYKRREPLFKPWNPTLGPSGNSWETLRLMAVNNMWKAVRVNRISPITVHLAIWLMNKLLVVQLKKNPCFNREMFAGIVAVSFRTALKFEERPEALWGIRKIWEVLPMFEAWNIDRSEQSLMRIESEALKMLNDCLDVPLSVQFFDKFVAVGGWPEDVAATYVSLGHFLLGLATFASGDQNPLCGLAPSKLAAAALVLAVKIVNGDSRRSYEFFPERFSAFCGLSLKDLQPAIKGLSVMLRRKPEEASILARVYSDWGEHEWQ